MKVTRLEECEKVPVNMEGIKGVEKQVPIGKADGAPNFSIRVFTIAPGGHTPHHNHAAEHLNYVIEGQGEVLSDGGPKPLTVGDYVVVLPNETHQYRNTGEVPMKIMCMVPSDYE